MKNSRPQPHAAPASAGCRVARPLSAPRDSAVAAPPLESEQSYREIFNAANDAIFIHDADTGAVLDVNDSMLHLFGVTREEALQLNINAGSLGLSPYSAVEAAQWLARARAEGPQVFEWQARKKSGELLWVEVVLKCATIRGHQRILAFVRDITQRKQNEQALLESERRYRAIFAQTGDYVFVFAVGPDGVPHIVDLNEAAERAHGYSRQELLGKPIHFLDPETTLEIHRERVAALAGGDMALFTAQHRRKDGSRFDVEVRAQIMREGPQLMIVAAERDVTERKQAADAISRIAREWQTTFDSTLDVIWLLDKNHRIMRSNKTAQEIFQRPNEEIVGSYCWEIVHGTACPSPECPANRACLTLRRESMHYPIGDRWFAIHVDPILDDGGDISGFVHIVSDITARKQAEELEKIRLEQLMQSERLASLGTLVTGVAHEINNPNMFIMLNTPLLKDILDDTLAVLKARPPQEQELCIGGETVDQLRETTEKIFANIVQGSERIQNIVTELKNYARETPTTRNECVDINQTVRSAVTLVWNRIKSATGNFSVTCAEALPHIRGNSQRIEQTVINLLTNACDALSDPGQAIRVATSHDAAAGNVVLRITDEGCGMPPEVLSRIRDPFFTTKRDSGGTGLGVSIIARIIEEHGGTMTYQSMPDQGTTVTVTLPVNA